MIYKPDQAAHLLQVLALKKKKVVKSVRLHQAALDKAFHAQRTPRYFVVGRIGNRKTRNRERVLDKIRALDDKFFKLYFRLAREDFYQLLSDVKELLPEPVTAQAQGYFRHRKPRVSLPCPVAAAADICDGAEDSHGDGGAAAQVRRRREAGHR